MKIDTTFLRRCIETLERSIDGVAATPPSDVLYDIYRAACVKEFELVLEQGGTLLRKRLSAFLASNRQADRLPFKDLFRHATKHGLIEIAAAERWAFLSRQPQYNGACL